jgi:hypothetical protein
MQHRVVRRANGVDEAVDEGVGVGIVGGAAAGQGERVKSTAPPSRPTRGTIETAKRMATLPL